MEIACSTDRNYLKYCITMLLSLFDHNEGKGIRVHLLANALTDEELAKVRSVVEKHGADFASYDVDNLLLDTLPKGQYGYITPTTYARLFLSILLPQEVKRVIYLDCDLLVMDSLQPLWEYPLDEGYEIGAVEDSCSANEGYYNRLHLSKEAHRYFNAGVLLIDLEAWRQADFVGRAKALLGRKDLQLDYADQDVLNVLSVGKTKYLPFRFNLQEPMLRVYMPEINVEAQRAIVKSLSIPVIIHFTYILKPWNYTSFHPYKRHFYYYFDQTEWSGERPSPSWREWLRKWLWGGASLLHLVNRYHPLPTRMLMKV